jgi:hypothetical protein
VTVCRERIHVEGLLLSLPQVQPPVAGDVYGSA